VGNVIDAEIEHDVQDESASLIRGQPCHESGEIEIVCIQRLARLGPGRGACSFESETSPTADRKVVEHVPAPCVTVDVPGDDVPVLPSAGVGLLSQVQSLVHVADVEKCRTGEGVPRG
jgi:hypothetical protein